MQKRKLQLFAIVSLTIFLTGCVGTNAVTNGHGIQKRKYTKGFYLEKNSISASVDEKEGPNSKSGRIEYIATEKNETPISNSTVDVTETNKGDKRLVDTRSVDVAEKNAQLETKTTNISQSQTIKNENLRQKSIVRINHSDRMLSRFKKLRMPLVSRSDMLKEGTNSNSLAATVSMVLLIILCFLLPWLAVGLYTGWDVKLTLIAVILWLLGWVPGIVFAFLVVLGVV